MELKATNVVAVHGLHLWRIHRAWVSLGKPKITHLYPVVGGYRTTETALRIARQCDGADLVLIDEHAPIDVLTLCVTYCTQRTIPWAIARDNEIFWRNEYGTEATMHFPAGEHIEATDFLYCAAGDCAQCWDARFSEKVAWEREDVPMWEEYKIGRHVCRVSVENGTPVIITQTLKDIDAYEAYNLIRKAFGTGVVVILITRPGSPLHTKGAQREFRDANVYGVAPAATPGHIEYILRKVREQGIAPWKR